MADSWKFKITTTIEISDGEDGYYLSKSGMEDWMPIQKEKAMKILQRGGFRSATNTENSAIKSIPTPESELPF